MILTEVNQDVRHVIHIEFQYYVYEFLQECFPKILCFIWYFLHEIAEKY